MTVAIRRIEPRDEPRWRELWDAYTRFYQREPSEPITRHLWERIRDVGVPVWAIVAEDSEEGVVGMANYVIHENTSSLTPICYLEDLYVQAGHRAGGVGKMLIDWLVSEARANGWSRLYWHTKDTNYRARGLYDKYTPHSGFLRYVIDTR